jgi:hypothetical protein
MRNVDCRSLSVGLVRIGLAILEPSKPVSKDPPASWKR